MIAFGKAFASIARDQIVMQIGRIWQSKQCLQHPVHMCAVSQIIAAGNKGDAIQRIIDNH